MVVIAKKYMGKGNKTSVLIGQTGVYSTDGLSICAIQNFSFSRYRQKIGN